MEGRAGTAKVPRVPGSRDVAQTAGRARRRLCRGCPTEVSQPAHGEGLVAGLGLLFLPPNHSLFPE